MVAHSPLMLAAFPASVTKSPKPKRKTGESGKSGTQVGEMAMSIASQPPPMKEPSHHERMIEDAHHEKRHATREWIAGRMSTAAHNKVHSRANVVIKHKGKVGSADRSESFGSAKRKSTEK